MREPLPTNTVVAPAWARLTPALLISALVLIGFGLAVMIPEARDWWKVIVLGVVEGLTEFLPISSTGHLLVASDALRFENSLGGTFEIFIQLGAVIAVVAFYAHNLLGQARALPRSPAARRFWLSIVAAFVPAAAVGLLLHDWIKAALFNPTVIALALIIGGVVLIAVERLPRHTVTSKLGQISLRQALIIGVAQVFALIPGTSRSASSIIGGMLSGLDRRTATAFSFYLAIPTLGAATVVDLLTNLDQVTPSDVGRLFLGAAVSLVVAWVSIGWLLRYVASNSFVAFGVYRILAGIVILALVSAGWL